MLFAIRPVGNWFTSCNSLLENESPLVILQGIKCKFPATAIATAILIYYKISKFKDSLRRTIKSSLFYTKLNRAWSTYNFSGYAFIMKEFCSFIFVLHEQHSSGIKILFFS